MNCEDQVAWDRFAAAALQGCVARLTEFIDRDITDLTKLAAEMANRMMLHRAARHLRLEREWVEKQPQFRPGRIDPPRDI